MTMHPPPDPDDLASDLVDGLLPPDEAARLRADPDIGARVEAIEAVRAAMRVTPPSAPGAIDRAIGAAMAALDAPSSSAMSSGERPTLTAVPPPPGMGFPSGRQVPTRARPPAKPSSGIKPWLAAAAAVLVGLLTVGLLSQGGSDQDDLASSSASDEATSAQDQAGGDGAGVPNDAAEEAPAAVPTTTAAGDTGSSVDDDSAPTVADTPNGDGQLGSVDDVTELTQRVASSARRPTVAQESTTDGESGDTNGAFGDEERFCFGLTETGDPTRGRAVSVGDAAFQGNPVKVHVYENPDGSLQLVATDRSCTDVVDTPYEP
jgi:hypothetical protein